MPGTALVGVALLNVLWKEDHATFLDIFVPLVAEVVRRARPEVVTDAEVKDGLLEHFGLDLPQHAVATINERARRRGYFRKEHRVLRPHWPEIEELGLEERSKKVEAIFDGTVDRLVEYCRAYHDIIWSRDEAADALQAYLSEFSLDVSLSEERHSAVPKVEAAPESAPLLVNLFLRRLHEEEPGAFDLVMRLVTGAMLANGIFVSDPYRLEQRFSDVRIYFDSPILLWVAGYGFDERTRPRRELLDLLRDLGANLRCYRQSVEEARGILEACATIMRKDTYDEATDPARENIDWFNWAGYTSSDVDRLAGRLDNTIRGFGIQIDDWPTPEGDYQINEPELEEFLRSEVGHRREEALRHDARAVAGIVQMRQGMAKHSIENCTALFATHNYGLAQAIQRYFAKGPLDGSAAIVMTDRDLATLAWLKRPLAAPDLPAGTVLAICHAAIQPSEELWTRFLAEIRRLRERDEISMRDYIWLRHSSRAKGALTEAARGDPEAFTDGTVAQVMRLAQRTRERELAEAIERERKGRVRSEEARTNQARTIRRRLTTVANAIGGAARWIVVAGGFASSGLGAYRMWPSGSPTASASGVRYLPSAVLVLLALLVFFFGAFTVVDVGGRLQAWLSEAIEGWLFAWFKVDKNDLGDSDTSPASRDIEEADS